MRWKAIWSRGNNSMTPGGVRGLIKRKTPGWRPQGGDDGKPTF
jgi:hypothetical protein